MNFSEISPQAKIGNNVKIGNFTVIKNNVVIGDNVVIGSNVLIDNGARIGNNVNIHHGAVISSIPQDLKYKGEETTLEIGDGTIVREYATLNKGTSYSGKTIIGSNCLIMAYAHIAHDCIIGNSVILANGVNLAGHVFIDDYAIIGGLCGIHQFCRIGKHSILAFHSRVVKDVPPYITAGSYPLKYEGLNLIGLKRRNFSSETINTIKEIYDIIYKGKYNIGDALEYIRKNYQIENEVKEIVEFIVSSNRGIISDR
ncbi:MAG: acyl-ACP--UDP-N-acetylglucosamine O-acyltransferase [Ignavibacteria bacterium]